MKKGNSNTETSHGSWKKRNVTGKRPLKSAVAGRKSVIKNTKNEPVVGRNNFQRARPCKGAELTPWLWTGGTREVGAQHFPDDPGRHGRFAAVDGWVYIRPCKTETKTFCFVYPKPSIFVPDTEKCPFLWLILLRYLLMIY